MKAKFNITSVFVFLIFVSVHLNAQFDDLYYDYKKDASNINTTTSIASSNTNQDYAYEDDDASSDNAEYDNAEYDNYDDYSYSKRIRRFHRPIVQNYYNSFDSWYDNYYYDPYFTDSYYSNGGINVFIGSGWGMNSWNAWNSPWSYNYWNRPWGWNSWNMGWGYNPWYNPYAWNSGWGWNSYGNCGNYGWGNNYYGNGWNNSGWNNNGWNNNGYEPSNKVFGSRKGGSLISSTRGRDASPRRINTDGSGKEVNVNNPENGVSSRTSQADRKVRSEIKSPNGENVNENTRKPERSRIFRAPDRGIDRNGVGSTNGNTNRTERNRTENSSDNQSRRQIDNTTTRRSESRSTFDNGSSRSNNDSWNSGSSTRSSGSFDNNVGSSRSSGSSSGSGTSRGGGSRRGG